MKRSLALIALASWMLHPAAAQDKQGKTLDMYFVDTEGGLAALYVSPSGESLLIDTGNPGGRDADRIMEAVRAAGVKQIDHLITTHYHVDHVGGLEELSKRITILESEIERHRSAIGEKQKSFQAAHSVFKR